MSKKVWRDVEGIGLLYREIDILHITSEPTLQICISNSNERYLVMLYDEYDDVYTITKTTTQQLINMLKGEISVNEVYREAKEIFDAESDGQGTRKLVTKRVSSNNFLEERLPKEDVFIDFHMEYFDMYINKLKTELNK